PGIPGVSLVLWGDSDGDDIPDWQGFGGVEITDENGYYRFGGLNPGNYLVFVWSVDNWAEGQPLHGWQSTTGYVSNANNDIDFDNNGFGEPFTDIKSGIVMLTTDGEPLLDGDPFNCYFDYDRSGNNTIDFGFFNPNITSSETAITNSSIKMFPNPTKDVLNIISERPIYELQLFDMMGRRLVQVNPQNQSYPLNLKFLSPGLYTLRILNERREVIGVRKIIKEGKD
ncbi:MAG: T9SS type A sorting domain-containing protein, partial [Saprospiraceae bacterium]|nr:T9SS type A sorting domain-containing protein [Saprospiraceae bacterium]